MDISAPGGNYFFFYARTAMVMADINWENNVEISKTLAKYPKFDNAGKPFGKKLNSEGFVFDQSKIGTLHSKYLTDWAEFKAQNPYVSDNLKGKLEAYDQNMIRNILELLM